MAEARARGTDAGLIFSLFLCCRGGAGEIPCSLLPKVPMFGSMGRVNTVFAKTMRRYRAFSRGFWSAWDFTRPFSEKPRMRRRNEDTDMQWVQELGLNVGYWEEVGNYLYKAIETYQKELSGDVSKQ